MRLRTALGLLFVLLVMPAAAGADPFTAPGNKVLWGGQGGYSAASIADFTRQSGKHPAVFNYFISWRASRSDMHWLSFRLADAERMRSRAMLSVSTDGTGLSPRDLARGGGDGFLITLGRLLAEQGGITYLRPLSEMNNGNNSYSPYDLSGRPRGAAFSTSQFKQAWRRLALVVRGGEVAEIDARLRQLGLPPVRTGADELATPQVALLWVPLSFGNPEIAKNHTPSTSGPEALTSTGSGRPGTRPIAIQARCTTSTAIRSGAASRSPSPNGACGARTDLTSWASSSASSEAIRAYAWPSTTSRPR
jgi:hypothetical protein